MHANKQQQRNVYTFKQQMRFSVWLNRPFSLLAYLMCTNYHAQTHIHRSLHRCAYTSIFMYLYTNVLRVYLYEIRISIAILVYMCVCVLCTTMTTTSPFHQTTRFQLQQLTHKHSQTHIHDLNGTVGTKSNLI